VGFFQLNAILPKEKKVTQIEIEIKLKAYDDLYFFTKEILGYSLLEDDTHKDLCDWLQTRKGNVIDLEPRDHFKTTCITIGLSIWLIINDPNIRILISHKLLKKAREILREIKDHFKKGKKFRYFFGSMVGEYWKADEIVVNTRTVNHKEPTIAIGAVDHEATSAHYDFIINDDLAGLSDMVSEASRVNTQNYISSLKFLRDKGSFIAMITTGTRWHLYDCYSKMLDNYKPENIRVKAAIMDDKPYFPSRYSVEELKEMEFDDPVFFQSQMMNNPTAMKDQLYTLDTLKFFDMDGFKESYTIAYIDPAFGEKVKGGLPCYFSMVIISIVNTDMFVIDWPTNQETPAQNELLVSDKIKEHKIRTLGIESNAQQTEFIRNVEKQLVIDNIIINIDPINHSTNKHRRIEGMHGTVKKFVHFRKDYAVAYPQAMKQLSLYPYSKFIDAPDCLEGGVSMAQTDYEPRIR